MAPHLRGSVLSKVVRSWTTIVPPLPIFDMRIGGFGPLVLLAAPFAVVTLVRRDSGPGGERASTRVTRWGVLLASVVAPDPSVARYVLSFPALVLAFAAPFAHRVPGRARLAVGVLAGAIAVAQLAQALPGLTGEGPRLLAYAGMTDDERTLAVGADGSPAPFFVARAMVGSGESFAFDQSMELPYLAWDSDLSTRAVWIPERLASAPAIEDFFARENVRVAAADEASPAGAWLSQNPERFLKLFSCPSAPCAVFARR
jgi:hypothetical protein